MKLPTMEPCLRFKPTSYVITMKILLTQLSLVSQPTLFFSAPTIFCVGGGKLQSVLRFFPNSAKTPLFTPFYI